LKQFFTVFLLFVEIICVANKIYNHLFEGEKKDEKMKKSMLLALLFSAVLFLSGCTTAPVSSVVANINNPSLGFSDLPPEAYTILGRVSGTGSVSYNQIKKVYTGDTLNYGYLGFMGNAGRLTSSTKKIFGIISTQSTTVTTPRDQYEMADSNAVYAMIMEAKALGADAIIFVTRVNENTISKDTITCNSTVSGLAVKLN